MAPTPIRIMWMAHASAMAVSANGAIDRRIMAEEASPMTAGLTVIRGSYDGGKMTFARSDGEVFRLEWQSDGHASLCHSTQTAPHGIGLDVRLPDKPSCAERLILAYQGDWPSAVNKLAAE